MILKFLIKKVYRGSIRWTKKGSLLKILCIFREMGAVLLPHAINKEGWGSLKISFKLSLIWIL